MNRERIKSIILSVLVLMSVLLTQKIWFHTPFQNAASDDFDLYQVNAYAEEMRASFISPIRAVVGFGGGKNLNSYYSVLPFDELKSTWEDSKAVLEPFFTGDTEVLETTKEKYYENMGRRFIELEFGDNISSVLIAAVFNSTDNKIVRNVKEVKKIMIPANNTGIIYIMDMDSSYFQIAIEGFNNDLLVERISQYEQKDLLKYYDLLSYVGNYTVMPLDFNIQLPQIYVESEIDINNELQLKEKSKTFFRNIDFIKTIKETTGAVVYLYGYGEKSLRINNRGRLEYREEFDPVSSTNVKRALEIALTYMDSKGDMSDNLFLREIREIEYKERKGFYFGFGYYLEGYPVYFNSSVGLKHAVEIEVVGNRIRGYRTFTRRKVNKPGAAKSEPVMSPHKIIENNLEMFTKNYLSAIQLPLVGESVSTEVIKNISEVQLVYYDSINEAKQQLLEACWKIRIKNHVYYFDIYKGRLLESTLLN